MPRCREAAGVAARSVLVFISHRLKEITGTWDAFVSRRSLVGSDNRLFKVHELSRCPVLFSLEDQFTFVFFFCP